MLCYCSTSCEGSGKQIVDSNAWLRGKSGQKAKEVQKQSRVQQKKKDMQGSKNKAGREIRQEGYCWYGTKGQKAMAKGQV